MLALTAEGAQRLALRRLGCDQAGSAPGSRAESDGCTTWSSVVHRDSHGGRVAEAVCCSRDSTALPGTSSWHAAGHALGTKA